MAVIEQTPYNKYTGNGTSTVYPFSFTLLKATDLQVSVGGVVTTAYTLSGIGNPSGGDVTFTTPPTDGAEVLIERVLPLSRDTDYQYAGDLRSDVVNPDFDRLWMALQQVFGQSSRSIHLGPGDEVGINTQLPAPVASQLIGWDETGQSLRYYNLGQAGTSDAAAVFYTPNGLTSSTRTVQSRLRDAISVMDYGATGDGVTDDWAAIQNAIDVAQALKRAVLFPCPAGGKYLVSRPLVLDDGQTLIGEGREMVFIEKTTTNGPSPALGIQVVVRGGINYNYDYDKNAVVIIKKPAGRSYPNGIGLHNITLQGKSGVTVDHGIYAPRLARSHFSDVYVNNVTSGLFTYDAFTCLFERVDCWNVSYGFRWENDGSGLGAGTSCTFIACGVNFSTVRGWMLYGLTYSSIIGSFSESVNGGSAGSRPEAWFFQLCKGLSVISCGSEVVQGYTFRISGGSVDIRGGQFTGLTGDTFSGNTAVVYADSGAKVSIGGGVRFDPVTSPGNIYNEIVVGAGTQIIYDGTVTRPSGGNTSPLFTGGGEIRVLGLNGGKDTRQDSTGTFFTQEYFQHQLTFYDPANIADGAYEDVTIIGSGSRAAMGDLVVCSFSLDLPGLFLAGRVSSAGAIKCQIRNESGAAVDLAGGTLLARVYPK